MSEFARGSAETAAAWRDRIGRVDPSALTAAQYQDWGVQRILAKGAEGDEVRATGERERRRAAADRAADQIAVDTDVLHVFKAAVRAMAPSDQAALLRWLQNGMPERAPLLAMPRTTAGPRPG